MTRIETIPPVLTLPPVAPSKREPTSRLIVLIPDLEVDYVPAMSRIWELANALHAHVLLLSLSKDAGQEPSLRRSLISMAAMVQDGHVLAAVKVEMGTNWVDIVERNYQTGDTIVCFAEPRAGIVHKPLSQILQSHLKIPVYILSSPYRPKPKLKLFSQVMAWLGSLGIITGFFLLQINIIQVSTGVLESILLILSLIPEYSLILFWNSQFG
jgi:hypothetical protein